MLRIFFHRSWTCRYTSATQLSSAQSKRDCCMQRSSSSNEQRRPISRESPTSFGKGRYSDVASQPGIHQTHADPATAAPEPTTQHPLASAKNPVPLSNISNHPAVHMDVQQASARFLDQVEATRTQYKKDVDQLMVDNEQLQAERKELQVAKDNATHEAQRAKQTVDQAKAELADTRALLSKAKLELEDVQGYAGIAIPPKTPSIRNRTKMNQATFCVGHVMSLHAGCIMLHCH